jgi:uncharacterized protein YutE (UPF0331/DUF86 family)
MTGFRNVAVHQYQEIDPQILQAIAEEGWKDFQQFCAKLGVKIDPYPNANSSSTQSP